MVFLKVVLVGLASPRGLTVQCFPQEYFSPTPPFHFRCVLIYNKAAAAERPRGDNGGRRKEKKKGFLPIKNSKKPKTK